MQIKRLRKGILFLILFPAVWFGSISWAQKTLIDITMEPSAILIGEQTLINVTITTDNGKDVRLILPRDTLMSGVEILGVSAPDSTVIENNRLVLKQDILITSFDSALYLLPPIQVLDGEELVQSNQVALKVSTVPVDDDPESYYDIKTIWKAPFVLADYYPLIFGILLTILIIVLIWYIIKRMRDRKSLIPFKKEEPKIPPHILAIKELDEIKVQKLWEHGREKEYYTQVTETLRKYIVGRFGINAMEMTSGEILDIIRKNTEAESVYDNLKQILNISDFVKFAKLSPLPSDNELSMMNAYLFVNQTKPVEVLKPEGDKNTVAEEANGETTNNE